EEIDGDRRPGAGEVDSRFAIGCADSGAFRSAPGEARQLGSERSTGAGREQVVAEQDRQAVEAELDAVRAGGQDQVATARVGRSLPGGAGRSREERVKDAGFKAQRAGGSATMLH